LGYRGWDEEEEEMHTNQMPCGFKELEEDWVWEAHQKVIVIVQAKKTGIVLK
jgi:hypothetical protein